MTDKTNTRQKSKVVPTADPRPHAKINPAFDDWLEKKLHHIFDSAAMEPIPKDLLKLLEKLDDVESAKKDKAEN